MVSMHMAYFRLENENLFSSEHCTHFALPSESWISIHSDKNLPTLDNPSHFYKRDQPHLQGFESFSNTIIQSKAKNLYWSNGKIHVVVMQQKDKSNRLFRNFIKSCFTLIWNTNLVPKASNKALDALGRKTRVFFWINLFNWITCLFWF